MALLRDKGHTVVPLTFHNKQLEDVPLLWRAAVTLWNREAYARVREAIRLHRPDTLHVHNTFPLASPAVIHVAKAERVPVVMTLHNYRLLCVNALFFRRGRVCEDCLGRIPWRGVLHGCYRDSRPASAVVAAMLSLHRALGTWNMVDRFIALTEFARQKFIEGGFPPEKISVKPNFVHPDPGPGEGRGGYALFVGRLSPEKGLGTLLMAWERLGGKVPLRIVGDGPLAPEVQEAQKQIPGVEWLGRKAPEEVYALMGEAAFLVFPSEWYETFGRVAIEAFAKGTPVLAAHIGAVGEVTEDGRTGLHFRPGDPEDLAAKVEWLLAHPNELARMRKEARAEYEAKYTAEQNYAQLMAIYHEVLSKRRYDGKRHGGA
ncbi:glycosyltransferase family 4 protein [Thermus aquaticus]|uniref:glycosyltransferase family 4 protein n=1 Tax=Thermus aquaticus TaxID=271 RepID=UPI001E566060|nr:glycosyltransferase family 4 protein [Thermus aquaticus]